MNTAKQSSLSLLSLIEKRFDFLYLPKVFHIAHSLPISSAAVEQTFSLMKLMKTAVRNRLQELTLQSLLMIHQEYKDSNKEKRIIVPTEVVELYNKFREEQNSQIKISW